jgi:uncharacterized membrane protein
MSAAERTFELFLRAYPTEFRAAYGREMMLFFRDQRSAGASGLLFWAVCAWDVARSAPALRVESWQSRWQRDIQSSEGVAMRMTMAVLSILIGAIEIVNALIEGRAATAVGMDPAAVTAVSFIVVAGILLVAAGIAQLVRSTRAPAVTLVAAATCAAVFALILVLSPRMSIFSTMLGIGYPIVLLIFMQLGRGGSARGIA